MCAATSKNLVKVMTTPTKLASVFDWRKMSGSTILSLDIHADRIGLARCDHPSGLLAVKQDDNSNSSSSSCHLLESIPLDCKQKSSIISTESKQRLSNLIKEYNVCGFIVSWPLQKDTGRMGASCGRTLFTLEQLMADQENSNSTAIFSANRPICLWDPQHVTPTPTDSFGRSPVFARTSTQSSHFASKEQYHQDEGISAAQVWQDFCQQHWPESQQQRHEVSKTITTSLVERASSASMSRTTRTSAGTWQSATSTRRRRTVLVAA